MTEKTTTAFASAVGAAQEFSRLYRESWLRHKDLPDEERDAAIHAEFFGESDHKPLTGA